jgi:hypothetical protein
MPTTFNPDKIIERLKTFNYRYYYNVNDSVINIYFPFLCFLKIDFKSNKIKMTGRAWLTEYRLERGFLGSAVALCFFIGFGTADIFKAMFLPAGAALIFSYHIICFIKTEAMKTIIHNSAVRCVHAPHFTNK